MSFIVYPAFPVVGCVGGLIQCERTMPNDDPKLISISPERLTFYPPYGTRQSFNVKMKSHSLKVVAYKIESNHSNFYVIKPKQGLLKPKEKLVVVFELNETFNKGAMDDDKKEHKFRLRAATWPYNPKHFDADLLTTLLELPGCQMTAMPVDIDRISPTFVAPLPLVDAPAEPKTETGLEPGIEEDKFQWIVDDLHGVIVIRLPTAVTGLLILVIAAIIGRMLG